MSKKLIAIAAAAALALTGLVAFPASATTITSIAVTHGGTAGATENPANVTTLESSQTSSTSAFTIASDNTDRKVTFGGSTDAVTRTSVRAVVTTGAAAAITVKATAGVRVAASLTNADGTAISAVDGGSDNIAGSTATAGTYTFFAWTTSTTAGSVTVETANSKIVFFVKAKAGPAYNLTNVTFPASLYEGQTDGKVTFNMTDQWGNQVTTGTGPTPTGFGAAFNAAATYNATTKLWSAALGTVNAGNVAINLAIAPTDLSANGFAKPVKSAFKLVSAGDVATLSASVATLTAQVAALQASMADMRTKARSVTKKKYNTLARKWNAANPGARVALK